MAEPDYIRKLDYLDETKSKIADSLRRRGQSVSEDDTFRSYADKIRNIASEASPGYFTFEVLSDNTLRVHYRESDGTPDFTLDASGHLILQYPDANAPPKFEVDGTTGHLIYDMEGA